MANRLETMFRRVAKSLENKQRAKLWKFPNDLRITSSGEAVFGDKGPADFIGHTKSGRCVLVECKDIQSSTLPMGTRGLKAHQYIALAELEKAGGIGILVWAREDQVAVLNVDMIKALTRGRKSISWSAVPTEYVLPLSEIGLMELLERHNV